MVFHWRLSDSKFPQVSRIIVSILAVLKNVVVWMVSTHPLISKSSSPFNNLFVTIPKAPITIGIIITFIFHSFFFQFTGPPKNNYENPKQQSSLFSKLRHLYLYGMLFQREPKKIFCLFNIFIFFYFLWSFIFLQIHENGLVVIIGLVWCGFMAYQSSLFFLNAKSILIHINSSISNIQYGLNIFFGLHTVNYNKSSISNNSV